MAVYTDGVHLTADSLDELHQFAKELNLKRKWFQGTKKYPHYDLTSDNVALRALLLGAKSVVPREIVKIAKRME